MPTVIELLQCADMLLSAVLLTRDEHLLLTRDELLLLMNGDRRKVDLVLMSEIGEL